MEKLALLGGKKTVQLTKKESWDLFHWPLVNREMEKAVLDVLRTGVMSGGEVTRKFEEGFAKWHGRKYGVACNNGTAALHCAMFGLKIGSGDEIICPSVTYWASCLPALSLGATVVFAEIHPETLCIDPRDIEKRITPRTKAIVAVHYCGYPADMDAILRIAKKHRLKVIEDVSHAHGALYKGRMVGTFGDVAAFSLMSGKSFAIGEGGILVTDDKEIYERSLAFGFYERTGSLTLDYLKAAAGLPWGGYKYRLNQLCSAVALVQLKKYPKEMREIDRAMNYFWDRLEGLPGIRAHRPPRGSRSTKGGWYFPLGRYVAEELGGLSITRFCEALRAEGVNSGPGCNRPLHLHPMFNDVDIYNDGKPTRIRNSPCDIRQKPGSLPVSEGILTKVFGIPWFKRYRPELIRKHVRAFEKVIKGYRELLKDDPGDPKSGGSWGLTFRR